MSTKFPRLVKKKWSRYTKMEKVFILYLVFLFICEIFLPVVKIEGKAVTLVNSYFLFTSFILLITLFLLIFWNVSFTFKNFLKSIFGLFENDALVNFGVLFLHASLLIFLKDLINLLSFTQSASFYQLDWGFYVLGLLLIFGLIWNLFLALNLSLLSKKRNNYSKIVANISEEDAKQSKEIKSLFE